MFYIWKQCPWGKVNYVEKIASGIWIVSTEEGRSGFKLNKEFNDKLPYYLKIGNGWYDDDSKWCNVVLGFPKYFSEHELKLASYIMKHCIPFEYKKFTGENVKVEESLFLQLIEKRKIIKKNHDM